MPKLQRENLGRASDQRWLGSRHALASARSSVLDPANFTPAEHFPDGYVPAGLPVNAADEGDLLPYTGAAGEKLRFVKDNHELVGAEPLNVATIWHGVIIVEFLPVPLEAAPADTENHLFELVGDLPEQLDEEEEGQG